MQHAIDPVAAETADPDLALRWLVRARRGALAVQAFLMVLAEAGTDLHVHSPALIAVLALWVTVDLAQAGWTRGRPAGPSLVRVHGAIDLVALTGILGLSGGPHNPLMTGYLVYLAMLAVVLPVREAWAVAFAAMGMQALVVWHPGHLPGLEEQSLPTAHLVGHIVAFDLAAVAITWIVSRLSAALRERVAAERAALQRGAATDRLAALGTLAAGVAHEIGTPLATIQLLAEEAHREAPEASAMPALVAQVDRCRAILDRLRGAERDAPSDCVPEVAVWVAEWRHVAPEVAVTVGAQPAGRVAGSESSWRAAVWVALDNARRAGATRVTIEAENLGRFLEVRLDDDGRGLDAEAIAHLGEPFRTGWGGTGLGVFVARTFAQSVGGDVLVQPGPSGVGARAVLRMPQVAE